jgi:hypothetical protein
VVLDSKFKSSKRNLTEVLDQILLKIRFVNDRALYAYEQKSLANTKQLEEVSIQYQITDLQFLNSIKMK